MRGGPNLPLHSNGPGAALLPGRFAIPLAAERGLFKWIKLLIQNDFSVE